MESHIQQLKKDKDRFRHKAVYWRAKTYQTKSSSEEREIEAIVQISSKKLIFYHRIYRMLKITIANFKKS